ncbi:c-type cytochrome biogenesis protein CcmI [Aliidiomarina sp. Khilg15.8]
MRYLMLFILLAIAVGLLLLARRRQTSTYTIEASNRALFEARLQELSADRSEGILSDEDYDRAVMELKKSFVAENANEEKAIIDKPAGVVLPIVVLVVVTVGLYYTFDSWRLQQRAAEARAALPELSQRILGDSDAQATQEEMEIFALGLRQRLAEEPDAGAWMLYGRLMMQQRQLEQALEAFERSLQLEPNRVSTLITYSQALIMSGSDVDLGQAARNIRRVIEEQPTNAEALGLLGVIAYERGDYEQAQQAWEMTLEVLNPDDPRYAAIEESLREVAERLDGNVLFLTVTVDISTELRNEMPANANLFVFVRDPDGQRAPAAVVRQRVSDFPTTVTLTEENAMVDGHTLATIDSWLVGARLTTSDTIEVRPGVMEARPRLLDKESGQSVTLTISELR